MKFKLSTCIFCTSALLLLNSGCNKQDSFLDAKPNAALIIPTSLSDCQSLLQYEGLFNVMAPGLGEIASDDYYVNSGNLTQFSNLQERNGYTWEKQVYNSGQSISDWNLPYQQVYYTNTVLEFLGKIQYNSNQQSLYNQVKGEALFFRAVAFYNLVQTFAKPYDSVTAKTDPGIPLRLSSNLNNPSVRASVQQCYDQVVKDLQTASLLLPASSAYKTQPSQTAANAMLARVTLATGNYTGAFEYANACLGQFNTLTNFNTLNPGNYTLTTNTFLAEDIFHTSMITYDIIAPNYLSITDSVLFRSYTSNDLRKTVFFMVNNGQPYFRGTYDYRYNDYCGLATDEMYLVRAECNARAGNLAVAMADLNTLLITRWKTGSFVPYTAPSSEEAVKLVLAERRKELLFRGLRWTDLRRLNKDSRFAVTPVRIVNGVTYTLPPNDPRYVWPIPDNEIQLSGIPQNPR